MAPSGDKRQRYRIFFTVIFVAVLLGTLFFGLRPRDYQFTNGVNWVGDQRGIAFHKYGIAYTNSIAALIQDNFLKQNAFSIEIGLKTASDKPEDGFRFVFSLHNGNDREQLLIGQWRSWIVIMNGDDYDHKRRTKRVAVDTSSKAPPQSLITITTSKEGTKVYFGNQLVRARKDFTLMIPRGQETRLLLGNSVYGRHSWSGYIYGLAFYGYALSAQDIANHSAQWDYSKSFSFAKKEKPLALYLFDEKHGSTVLDHTTNQNHIIIPAKMKILEKEILSKTGNHLKMDKHFLADVVINLVGFLPLGFIVSAALYQLGGAFQRHSFAMAIAFCFLTSLTIEIVQAWLPSRSSQMLDLMLNTIGGLSGAAIYSFVTAKARKKLTYNTSI